MKNKINLLCVAFFSLLLAGCEKENNDFVGSDNYIISFKLVNGEQEWPAIIADNNITVTVRSRGRIGNLRTRGGFARSGFDYGLGGVP